MEFLQKAKFMSVFKSKSYRWIIEKAREFQKNTYFCFIDHAKAFDSLDHNELWKILINQLYFN